MPRAADDDLPSAGGTGSGSRRTAASDYPGKKFGMCCPAHPVVDGVCCVKDGVIYDIPDKSNLYAFQTPECFNYGEFEEIYSAVKNREKYLGIAELFLAAGKKPHIILSDDRCFKVTTPIDLDVLNVMLQKG